MKISNSFLLLICLWSVKLQAQYSNNDKDEYKNEGFTLLASLGAYYSQFHPNQFNSIRQLQSHTPGIQGGLLLYHCENQKSSTHYLSMEYNPSIVNGTQHSSYQQAQNSYSIAMRTHLSSFGIRYEYRKGYRLNNLLEAYGTVGIGFSSDSVFQEIDILLTDSNSQGLPTPIKELYDTYNYKRTLYPASIGIGVILFNTTKLLSLDLGVKYSYPLVYQPTIKYINFESIEYPNQQLAYSFEETTMNHWQYYITLRISFLKRWPFG